MARSHRLRTRIDRTRAQHPHASLGSTGSRLISGNSETAERLEARLAAYHRAESGLLFGSGYAANSGLLASIAGPGDTLVMDELIHASSIDGAQLSKARKLVFRHNDLDDLAVRLDMASGPTFICVESLYSMGGDMAPLPEMAELAGEYGVQWSKTAWKTTSLPGFTPSAKAWACMGPWYWVQEPCAITW